MNQNEPAGMATKSAKLAEISEPGRGRRLAVFGAGYVGGALARRALANGWRVTALTRNAATAAELRAAGADVVVAELASDSWWSAPEFAGVAERVAVTVAAGGGGAEGYRRSYVEGLRSVVGWGRWSAERGILGRLVYTSSTSVYPQDGGARVTEADAVGGDAETTRALVEAERICGEWTQATGAGATVLRLAGIYGPERVHMVEQVRSGEVSGKGEFHLNLIYRDDILNAMEAVWEQGAGSGELGARSGERGAGSGERGAGSRERGAGSGEQEGEAGAWARTAFAGSQLPAPSSQLFNICDEGAATKGEVVAWLAERLGVAMPRFTGLPAGGRRMVTPDRIIDASKARAVLGWRPRFPTFREGYAEVLKS